MGFSLLVPGCGFLFLRACDWLCQYVGVLCIAHQSSWLVFGGLLCCGHGFLLGSQSPRHGCGRFLVCLSCARVVGLWFVLLLVCLSRAVGVILLT